MQTQTHTHSDQSLPGEGRLNAALLMAQWLSETIVRDMAVAWVHKVHICDCPPVLRLLGSPAQVRTEHKRRLS